MFPVTITYLIWVPLEIFFYAVVAYFSKKNNSVKNKKILAIMIGLNLIPLWAFVAPDSASLAFDMLLYDTLMTLTLTSALVLLGAAVKFKRHNWLGVIVVIIGFILMKL
ncbi:MAG: hypothetical protein WC668_00845 [Patescibacteria group bacterium]|jgi:hypothetical protein